MTTLLVVRHGLSATNKAKVFTGQYDAPLDALGHRQAICTAEYLFNTYTVDAVYSSDLSRAVDTARPTAEKFGLPIRLVPEIREIDVGHWQQISHVEAERRYPEEYLQWKTNIGFAQCPGGESYAMMQQRCEAALAQIVAENDGKTVAVFTHGGALRALVCGWLGFGLEKVHDIPLVPNASVTVVQFENGRAAVITAGYDAHLDGLKEKTDAQMDQTH